MVVERLVNIVLLDRETNLCSIVSCYFIHFVAVGKLLIHNLFLVRSEFQYRNESKVFSIVNNSISNCRDCFSFFFKKIELLSFFELSQLNFPEQLKAEFKINFSL